MTYSWKLIYHWCFRVHTWEILKYNKTQEAETRLLIISVCEKLIFDLLRYDMTVMNTSGAIRTGVSIIAFRLLHQYVCFRRIVKVRTDLTKITPFFNHILEKYPTNVYFHLTPLRGQRFHMNTVTHMKCVLYLTCQNFIGQQLCNLKSKMTTCP